MELPDLGKNCSETSCKQLDFLPMKCDSCQKIFCKDHFAYTNHHCPESYRKDNQVPVCPLCNSPVSVKKGQQPDFVVGQHIDNDCQSDPAKQKRKVYSNKCNMKGCKQKELIPITCDRCKKNFCLKHRLDTDHNCAGFEGSGRGVSNAGAAAVSRGQASSSKSNGPFKASQKPQLRQQKLTEMGSDLDRERRERATGPAGSGGSSAQTFQAGMSEDEAMARALAMSMQESQPSNQPTASRSATQQEQEEADAALARALQASEEEAATARRQPQQAEEASREKKSSCAMS